MPLLTVACAQPESFRAAEGQDAGSSNSLIPNVAGDGAAGATDGGGATSGHDGSGGTVDAAAMASADAAKPDAIDADGGVSSGDGGLGSAGNDGAAAGEPDAVVLDAAPDAPPTDGAVAQEVGGSEDATASADGASSAEDAHDAGSADAGTRDAGAEAPSGVAAVCINAGGPTVEPCRADFGYSGGSARSHQSAIDLSRAQAPAPAAVYETARIGTFTYAVSGFAPGSAHLVRLHFVETYLTSRGQRVCDITSGAVAVLTHFDIYAAAGGANIVTIQDRLLNADASGRINLGFARVSNGSSCLVSAIEVR